MKASEISTSLIGKKISYVKEILTWSGKVNIHFVGEIIGVDKTDSFIDITIVTKLGKPFENTIHHIGINFETGYNEIENAEII